MSIRQARALHRDTRGSMSAAMLFLVVVLWAAIALVWNVGVAVDEKYRAQTAADSAAHAAAVALSRTTNVVTATNIQIVRAASAESLAFAVVPTALAIIANWSEEIGSAGWLAPVVAAYIVAFEFPVLLYFLEQTGPTALGEGLSQSLLDRAKDLHAWQRETIRATSTFIEHQRQSIQSFYACEITLSQLGSRSSVLRPPVRTPHGLLESHATFALLLETRIALDRANWERALRTIRLGKGPQSWAASTSAMGGIVTLLVNGRFHVLESHAGLLERSPTDRQRARAFAVTAVAKPRAWSQERHAMPGLYPDTRNRPGSSLAFAQAETFHPGDLNWLPAPWRVWSMAGWNWQPRLTRSTSLPDLLRQDDRLRQTFQRVGAPVDDPASLRKLIQH